MITAAREAIAGLLEAVSTPMDRNDLGRLAQMHSWGQHLCDAASPAGGNVIGEGVGRLAGGLVKLLERLILDEATDPQASIALVPEAVQVLSQVFEGKSADVEGLLARIDTALDDGGPAEQPAAAPPAAAQPKPQPQPVKIPAPAPAPAEQPAPAARVPAVPATPAPAADAAPVERYVSEPLTIDMDEREHLDGFLEEATEHMDAIETGLLEVESDPSNTDKINELFRPFHTIKGIAGFLNLRDINRLTHEMETILDLGRKGEVSITAGTIDLIFAGVDSLKAQLDAIRRYMAEPTGGPCSQPDITEIMAQLRRAARPGAVVEPRQKLGEILVTERAVSEEDIDDALKEQAGDTPPPRKVGEILVERGAVTDSQVEQALLQQASGKPIIDQSIRVDTRKLDFLVDAVGELVIAQAMVGVAEAVATDEKLQRNVSQVTKIVRDVQETAMAMRMVPIGQTFQKMRRLVRDVSRKAGKNVELTINGEETELDKNVIQQISDPLVHMVRNAVDHGIESADKRRAAGKPEAGQVLLNAYHQGDSIVIEIRDDGQGLDPRKLIAKGRERGLVGPDEHLSDPQAFALILAAGFSTAEQVTDISGRGVGMDVVRRNVEQLRGKIEIDSQPGQGSTFHIRLPLTLAIIDGMLVRVADERMIIPTILIEQSLRPERKQITSVQQRGAMLQVRGELCPMIQLGSLFGYGAPIDPCEHLVVIVQCEAQKIALVVEELIGQQQVVIKNLGQRFKQVHGVSGAAILGDGRVGVILEPSGIMALHKAQGCGTFVPPQRATGGRRGAAELDPADDEGWRLIDAAQDDGEETERLTGDADRASPLDEVACSEQPAALPV